MTKFANFDCEKFKPMLRILQDIVQVWNLLQRKQAPMKCRKRRRNSDIISDVNYKLINQVKLGSKNKQEEGNDDEE